MSPPTCDTKILRVSFISTPTFDDSSFENRNSSLFSNPAINNLFLKLEIIEQDGGLVFSKTPPAV